MKFKLWPYPVYVVQLLGLAGAWAAEPLQGESSSCETRAATDDYAFPSIEGLIHDHFYGIVGPEGTFRISVYKGPGWRRGTYLFYDPVLDRRRVWRASEILYFKRLGPEVREGPDFSLLRRDNWKEQSAEPKLFKKNSFIVRGARALASEAPKVVDLFEDFDRWLMAQVGIPPARKTLIVLKDSNALGAAAWPQVRRNLFLRLQENDRSRQVILLTRKLGRFNQTEIIEPSRALHERLHSAFLSFFRPKDFLRSNAFLHEVFADFFVCVYRGCAQIGRTTKGAYLRDISRRECMRDGPGDQLSVDTVANIFEVFENDDSGAAFFSPHRASLLLNESLWSLAKQMTGENFWPFLRLYLDQLNSRRAAFLEVMQTRGVPQAYLNDYGNQPGMALLDLSYAYAVAIKVLRSRPEWRGFSGIMQVGAANAGLDENNLESIIALLCP